MKHGFACCWAARPEGRDELLGRQVSKHVGKALPVRKIQLGRRVIDQENRKRPGVLMKDVNLGQEEPVADAFLFTAREDLVGWVLINTDIHVGPVRAYGSDSSLAIALATSQQRFLQCLSSRMTGVISEFQVQRAIKHEGPLAKPRGDILEMGMAQRRDCFPLTAQRQFPPRDHIIGRSQTQGSVALLEGTVVAAPMGVE